MASKRLFIGTFIRSDELNEIISQFQQQLINITYGKWVEPDNLHFTYHFLGDIGFNLIEELKTELEKLCIEYCSELVFNGLGCFPDSNNPRVLFMNLYDKDNILKSIYNDTKEKLFKFGYVPDKREFKPHLTLQRIKNVDSKIFKSFLEKYNNKHFYSIQNFTCNLIESKLKKSGPEYLII